MLENLQFIESLYLPDYINVVFEYCNVKYISYTKYFKWELENISLASVILVARL